MAGFVSAAFVPSYGWQMLFYIGGIVPVVIALAAIMGLPESIKYMALHESQRAKMEALHHAIRPDFQVPPNARFVIEDEQQSPSSNPIHLFSNGLAAITPLTWLMFALQPDGLFLPDQLDADADDGGACDAGGRGAVRCGASGRRHRRRTGPVLVAAAAALPRHRDPVRDRSAGRRLDRLCGPDLDQRRC